MTKPKVPAVQSLREKKELEKAFFLKMDLEELKKLKQEKDEDYEKLSIENDQKLE